MKRKTGAYFTVEAVLILPIVLGVILLIMYLWFFQYNRCLMEQDMGALALRGTAIQEADQKELVRKIRKDADNLYWDKYVAWRKDEVEVRVEKGKLLIKGRGGLRFPFQGFRFWKGEDFWDTEASYKNILLSPTSIIRKYRRLTGGK